MQLGVVQVFESNELVEVSEIQVLPGHQNRGIGTRVLSDVIAGAQERGQDVTLYLGIKNTAALRLYKRLGFDETKRSDSQIFMTHLLGSNPR